MEEDIDTNIDVGRIRSTKKSKEIQEKHNSVQDLHKRRGEGE